MYYNKNNNSIVDNLPDIIKLHNGTIITGPINDANIAAAAGFFSVRSDKPDQPENTNEDISRRIINIDGNFVDIIRTWIPKQNTIPETVSARQIRLWLIENNISLNSVENAINNIPDEKLREKTLVEWEYAPYIERSHPLLNTLGQVLGLTNDQIDIAFLNASKL